MVVFQSWIYSRHEALLTLSAVIFLVGVNKMAEPARHPGVDLSFPLSGPELGATCHPPPVGTFVNCLEIFLEVTSRNVCYSCYVLHRDWGHC